MSSKKTFKKWLIQDNLFYTILAYLIPTLFIIKEIIISGYENCKEWVIFYFILEFVLTLGFIDDYMKYKKENDKIEL